MDRIWLFPLLFQNGCSQSSRFPTAGQRERRRNEIALSPSPIVLTISNNPEYAWLYLEHLALHYFIGFFSLDPGSSILDPRSSILDPRSSILDPRSSILDPPSRFSRKPMFGRICDRFLFISVSQSPIRKMDQTHYSTIISIGAGFLTAAGISRLS